MELDEEPRQFAERVLDGELKPDSAWGDAHTWAEAHTQWIILVRHFRLPACFILHMAFRMQRNVIVLRLGQWRRLRAGDAISRPGLACRDAGERGARGLRRSAGQSWCADDGRRGDHRRSGTIRRGG